MKKVARLFLIVFFIFCASLISYASPADDYLEFVRTKYADDLREIEQKLNNDLDVRLDAPISTDYLFPVNYIEVENIDDFISEIRERPLADSIVDRYAFKYMSPGSHFSLNIIKTSGQWEIGGTEGDLAGFRTALPDVEMTPAGLVGYIAANYPDVDPSEILFINVNQYVGSELIRFVSDGTERILLFDPLDTLGIERFTFLTVDEFAELLQKDRDEFFANGGRMPDETGKDLDGGASNGFDGANNDTAKYVVIGAAAAAVICAAVVTAVVIKKKKQAPRG